MKKVVFSFFIIFFSINLFAQNNQKNSILSEEKKIKIEKIKNNIKKILGCNMVVGGTLFATLTVFFNLFRCWNDIIKEQSICLCRNDYRYNSSDDPVNCVCTYRHLLEYLGFTFLVTIPHIVTSVCSIKKGLQLLEEK